MRDQLLAEAEHTKHTINTLPVEFESAIPIIKRLET